MHFIWGPVAIIGAISAAAGAIGWASDEIGDAVNDPGNGALKIAAAGAGGVAVYYAWSRI